MLTTGTMTALSAAGRRLTRHEIARGLNPGPSGLGIIPLAIAAVGAAGSAAGSYFQSQAAGDIAKAQIGVAEAQAEAIWRPYKYEYKTAKELLEAQRFELAMDAVSGQTVSLVKDTSPLWIAGAIGLAMVIGAFLLVKGT